MFSTLIIVIPAVPFSAYISNLTLLESVGNLFNQGKALKLHTGSLW